MATRMGFEEMKYDENFGESEGRQFPPFCCEIFLSFIFMEFLVLSECGKNLCRDWISTEYFQCTW